MISLLKYIFKIKILYFNSIVLNLIIYVSVINVAIVPFMLKVEIFFTLIFYFFGFIHEFVFLFWNYSCVNKNIVYKKTF